jgi:hypothetical protein
MDLAGIPSCSSSTARHAQQLEIPARFCHNHERNVYLTCVRVRDNTLIYYRCVTPLGVEAICFACGGGRQKAATPRLQRHSSGNFNDPDFTLFTLPRKNI